MNEAEVKQRYGKIPSEDVAVAYAKAIKVIIGADGEVHSDEMAALVKGMKRLGADASQIDLIKSFDIQGVDLAALMPGMKKGGKRARMLIRDAIEISRADGVFAKEEKEAVYQAADLLGVDQKTVKALQSLVEMERATKRMRKALL